jgi:hypothetical protein
MHGLVKTVTWEEFYESFREFFEAILFFTFFIGAPEVKLFVGVNKIFAVEVLKAGI